MRSKKLNEAVQMHIGLVYFVLNNVLSFGFRIRSLEDSLQEGTIGLQEAIERFDFSKNSKLSTYAVIWIESKIRRFNAEDDLVRIPVHIQELRSKVRRMGMHIQEGVSDTQIIKEVAKLLDLDEDGLVAKLQHTMWHQVLEPIEKYVETLVDQAVKLPEEQAEFDKLQEEVREVISSLTPRQQRVIRMRFGILEGDAYDQDMTLEVISERFDVTRERVRQIESKSLRTLRHPTRADLLRSFLDPDYRNYEYENKPRMHEVPRVAGEGLQNTTSRLHDNGQIES